MLFTENISNWTDWGNVYQSIPAFSELSQEILRRENLPVCEIENLTPGTNAVFKAGDYVLKIYAPKESRMDQTLDRETEIFTMKFADSHGVATPSLVAEGTISDKYDFAYIVMKHIEGEELDKALSRSGKEKQYELGKLLRAETEKLNIPCEAFNNIDILHDPLRDSRWEKFPGSFRQERLDYIHSRDSGDFVFVHGDLCIGNMILGDKLYLIDFADAVLAPKCYEFIPIVFDYIDFPDFLRGYFEGNTEEYVAESLFDGLLLHGFGGPIAAGAFGESIDSLEALRDKVDHITKKILNS